MDTHNNLKIVSDGTPEGTMVYDSNGLIIENVESIEWNYTDNNKCWATIEIARIPIEAGGVRRYS